MPIRVTLRLILGVSVGVLAFLAADMILKVNAA
jgi:hypothetical protein